MQFLLRTTVGCQSQSLGSASLCRQAVPANEFCKIGVAPPHHLFPKLVPEFFSLAYLFYQTTSAVVWATCHIRAHQRNAP